LKDSRKLEDLILAFVSASTRALKKEQDLAEGRWKEELNAQILVFLDLLGDNLGSVGSGAGELRARLSTYRSRLNPDRITPSQPQASPPEDEHRPAPVADPIVFVDIVRPIMNMSDHEFAERCEIMKATCTVDAAVDDAKVSTVAKDEI
jgi:hypothetical protein